MKNELNIPSCESALTIDEIEYTELQLSSFDSNDPKTVTLILDHQGVSDGAVNEENTDKPVVIKVGFRLIESELMDALTDAFNKKKRIALSIVDADNGTMVNVSKAVINSSPKNRRVEAGAQDRFNVELTLHTARRNNKETNG